ncbi:MAG: hypothetical protein ACHQHO_04730 [Solirubrobacterales bacterium]
MEVAFRETVHEAKQRGQTVFLPSHILSIPYTRFVGPIGSGLDEMIAEAQQHMESLPGVRGDATYGLTGEELAEFGAGVDLLIVGSRGYGPLRRVMLGRTSINLHSRARAALDPAAGHALRVIEPGCRGGGRRVSDRGLIPRDRSSGIRAATARRGDRSRRYRPRDGGGRRKAR